ncbi:MAG: sugar ABC transporter permease [Eubacteriales bacterium]
MNNSQDQINGKKNRRPLRTIKKAAAVQSGNAPGTGRKKRRVRYERGDKRKTSIFLIPSLIGVLTFFIVPFCVIIYYSLVDNPIQKNFVGFQNFINLLNNSAFRMACKNTFTFSATAVPLAVILSLLLAILLQSNLPFRTQFRTIFITPLMVPVASIVLIWQVLFHYNGALNDFLANFGMVPVDWLKSEYSQVVIVVLYLWKNIGYNMILFMSALSNIPGDVLEVATLEGAGELRKFWYIKIRYLSSSILFVTILSLINSFKVFREVYLLTGDYPYDSLYMLQHFMNNTFKSLDYQKLSTAAIIICLAMIIIIGVLIFIDNKLGGDIEE